MKHLTASTSPSPFSGENWFDPLEDAIRFRVRAFIEAVVAEEAQAALGGRARYQRSGAPKGYRNGHRHRQLVGTFGALTVSLPRVRLLDGDGGEKEWRSQTIQAYKRLTKRAEAIIANTYLAGTNTRRVRRALAGLFGGKVGKDAVSRGGAVISPAASAAGALASWVSAGSFASGGVSVAPPFAMFVGSCDTTASSAPGTAPAPGTASSARSFAGVSKIGILTISGTNVSKASRIDPL